MHDLRTGVRCGSNELASVDFAPIPEHVVERVIADRSIFAEAGAFAIEDPHFAPYVRRIHGTREAVIGLPIDALRTLLTRTREAAAAARTAADAHRLPLPSELAPGVTIRLLRPGDEQAARALFAAGMRETIVPGLRQELLRADATRAAVVAGAAATVALAVPPRTALIVAAAAALGVVAAVCALPPLLARGYIRKSLATDLRAPCAHYLSRRGACFWVAVEDATATLVGTVALRPAGVDPGSQWRAGDAELRRMSVAGGARRRGVARALFATLARFAAQSGGYRRIVLETSTLQAAAHDRLYPALGFVAESRQHVFGRVSATYFARPL